MRPCCRFANAVQRYIASLFICHTMDGIVTEQVQLRSRDPIIIIVSKLRLMSSLDRIAPSEGNRVSNRGGYGKVLLSFRR